ncbi:MAG: hypothetical protein HQM06_03570 [Magnetococcales bacterium]|nr:hypothetical protein [Magnetococcales bacterium]
MDFIVDAWLERPEPRIVVSNAHNGRAVLDWDHHTVARLFASGAMSPTDFQPSSPGEQWELVRELFYLQHVFAV